MKAGTLVALAAMLVIGRSLPAQIVVQPEPALTPIQATVRNVLYQLRDSLQQVEAASARFARDRGTASDAAMQSRARLMAERCGAAHSLADSARKVVAANSLPQSDPRAVRVALDKALVELKGKLQWCSTEFSRLSQKAQAEELRDYAIGRGKQVQDAVWRYRPRVQQYFVDALGVRYSPNTKGAGATPSGAGS